MITATNNKHKIAKELNDYCKPHNDEKGLLLVLPIWIDNIESEWKIASLNSFL